MRGEVGTGQAMEEPRDDQDQGWCHPHLIHTLVSAEVTAEQETLFMSWRHEVTLPSQGLKGLNHGHSRVRSRCLKPLTDDFCSK